MAQERAPAVPVRFYRTDAGTEPALDWLRKRRPPRIWRWHEDG